MKSTILSFRVPFSKQNLHVMAIWRVENQIVKMTTESSNKGAKSTLIDILVEISIQGLEVCLSNLLIWKWNEKVMNPKNGKTCCSLTILGQLESTCFESCKVNYREEISGDFVANLTSPWFVYAPIWLQMH